MKKTIFPIVEFVLLVTFFGVIPYVLFFETFPTNIAKETASISLISFGTIVAVILIFICVKKFVIDPRLKDIGTRIGILKDRAATESDAGATIKCYKRIAWFENLRTLINMVVPVLAVVLAVFMFNNLSEFITKVCTDLTEAQGYIKRLNHTIMLASVSFGMGVLTQFIFPWLRLRAATNTKLRAVANETI